MSNGGIIGPVQNPVAFTVNSTTNTFTAPGTFTSQAGQTKVDLLVIAGGGGGQSQASSRGAGGGGAGGYREFTCFSITPSTAVPVTIGGGGAIGSAGTNSSFNFPTNPITSSGGGAGGSPGSPQAGGSGGSGGGAGSKGPGTPVPSAALGGSGNSGSYSPPEGNPGGNNPDAPTETNPNAGSGGGGAGFAGNGLQSNTRGGAGGYGGFQFVLIKDSLTGALFIYSINSSANFSSYHKLVNCSLDKLLYLPDLDFKSFNCSLSGTPYFNLASDKTLTI
jgi:hypothetical protein